MPTEKEIVWDAEFNESVTNYWLLNGALILVVTIIGIVLLPVWYFFGKWFTRRYLESHKCTLTNRTLKVEKGIWIRIEKTVPLDRITDLGILQGPIMRYLDIETLTVETAGQSSANSLVHLAGIKNGRDFRDAVLRQRDLVVGSKEDQANLVGSDSLAGGAQTELLTEIRNILSRMESGSK